MTEEQIPVVPVVLEPSQPATPMEMLSRALERGADLSVLEKLMDLQERHERNQAKKAFDAAIAAAKAEIKPIIRNRTGNNSKKYADFAAYAEGVDAILAKNGLNYRHRSQQPEKEIAVTCILSHRDGYAEDTTLKSPPDTTGNKNAIQAIGSTITYLQRYTLALALGLASAEDDDGQAAGGDAPITDEERDALLSKINEADANIAMFCESFKIEAVPDLRQSQLKKAHALLDAKIKKNASKKSAT